MTDLPTSTRRWLDRIAPFRPAVVLVPEGSKTAVDAAAGVGCEVAHIVKSLVFVVGDEPVVALVPGDRRLDPGLLSAAAGGAAVRRASLDEVRTATGYVAGGTPPFGHARPLRVFADTALDPDARLWIAAGTPNTVAPIDHADLVARSAAVEAPLSHPG